MKKGQKISVKTETLGLDNEPFIANLEAEVHRFSKNGWLRLVVKKASAIWITCRVKKMQNGSYEGSRNVIAIDHDVRTKTVQKITIIND